MQRSRLGIVQEGAGRARHLLRQICQASNKSLVETPGASSSAHSVAGCAEVGGLMGCRGIFVPKP